MDILIIGEFSSFAKHLKKGFLALGHSVTIVQSGDGWKKLSSSDDIICKDRTWSFLGRPISGSNRILAIFTNFRVNRQLKRRIPRPTLIIVINYTFLRNGITNAGVSCRYLLKCKKNGAKIIMSECGESCAEAYFRPELMKVFNKKVTKEDKRYSLLLSISTVIIPTAFHYYEQLLAYKSYHKFDDTKVLNAIPLPINIDADFKVNPIDKRKIVVFHGVIRPIEKGTPIIQDAMDRLQNEMPDKVNCICCGGMPYDEYVKLFDSVDILVDQTYCNGWGMNAEIAAMKAKCVLVSCGPENNINMGIKEIPFVQISPDSEQIYRTLKELVLDPQRVDALKLASRKFIENNCECSLIARRYIKSVNL